MPDPGSHSFDVKRTRLRGEYERDHVPSVPDQHADAAAREDLERDHPARRLDDDRAAGPLGDRDGGPRAPAGAERRIELRSPAFSDHDFLPERYARDRGDASPPLEWTDVPDGTAELAVLCEDPDAPGTTFTHWLVTGIPAGTTGLAEGEVPDGATAVRNDYGEAGWGGPLPPAGDEAHRYFFRLLALDEPLAVGPDASAADVRTAVQDHELASGTLVGLFGR
jgi:hypothetical protein